jgi:hypothetical protein
MILSFMTSTLEDINSKLKHAPQEFLERVLGYIDGLIDTGDFILTKELKNELEEIRQRPISAFIPEEEIDDEIMSKYDL